MGDGLVIQEDITQEDITLKDKGVLRKK